MVANDATEAAALAAANQLARQLSASDILAASLTNEQAADYAAAIQALTPFNVALPAGAAMVAGRHPGADKLLEVVVERDQEGRAGGLRVTAKAGRQRWAQSAHGAHLLCTNCPEKDPAQLWRW